MKLELSAGFALDVTAAEGDMPGRTISGIAAPYNTTATVGGPTGGTKVQFAVGSLPVTGKAPKLMMYHDSTMPVGLVTSRTETPNGMMFSARIAETVAGNDALQLAKEGVLDNVSVGVNVIDSYTADDGTMIITAAEWTELSLTPTPAFQGATITSVTASVETLPDAEIEETKTDSVEEKTEMSEVTAAAPEAAPVNPIWATPKKEFAMPTPGEYMAAYATGGDTFARVNEAIKANKTTSAFTASVAQDLLGDTPGLLPTPVLGNLFLSYNYMRPVVSAFGARALPNGNGFSFIRPTIQQHTASGVQSPDGSELASQAMVLKANQVDRVTVGGAVFVSAQVADFTSPAAQGLILQDLAGQYMKQTETLACNALEAQATTSGATWTVGANDTASLLSALYTAAYNISIDTNLFGTTLVVDPLTWKYLGSATNDVGSPVFPAIGAPGLVGQNTLGAGDAAKWSGMNPMGLDIVVSGNLSAKTMLVCHAPAVEFYETVRGVQMLQNVNLLGYDYNFSGTFASFLQTIGTESDSIFVQSIVVSD